MDWKKIMMWGGGGLVGLFLLSRLGGKKGEVIEKEVPVPFIMSGGAGANFASGASEAGIGGLAESGLVWQPQTSGEINPDIEIARINAGVLDRFNAGQQSLAGQVLDLFSTPANESPEFGTSVLDTRQVTPTPSRQLTTQDINIGTTAIKRAVQNRNVDLSDPKQFNQTATSIHDAAVRTGVTSASDLAMLINRATGSSLAGGDVLAWQQQQGLTGLN